MRKRTDTVPCSGNSAGDGGLKDSSCFVIRIDNDYDNYVSPYRTGSAYQERCGVLPLLLLRSELALLAF